MLFNLLLCGALLSRLMAPVAAVPRFMGRDEFCTATVTVYASTSGLPPPSLITSTDIDPQTVTVISTVTVTSTTVGGASPSGASSSGQAQPETPISIAMESPALTPETVTVLDITTITSTIYASEPNAQQITNSPNASGPQTVTVTVTSVLTSVETLTTVQTQILTLTQIVTETLTQANSVQTAINGLLLEDSDEPSVSYMTVTSTLTTTLTISTPVLAHGLLNVRPALTSSAAVPPQPTNPPHYSNDTQAGQYRNSSNAPPAKPPAGFFDQSVSDLTSGPTSVSLAPTPSVLPNYYNSSPPGYENGLYFVNWSVSPHLPPPPIFGQDRRTDTRAGGSMAPTFSHSPFRLLTSLASTMPSRISAAMAL